jgi:integrase
MAQTLDTASPDVGAAEASARRGKMPRIDITEKSVRKLPLGSGTYLDNSMRGFMVVCNAASKSYVFQRDVNGRATRVTLGRAGEVTADVARDLAMKTWLQMKDGRNPNEERREARVRGTTLAEAFDLYKAGGEDWSPKTLVEYEGIYKRYLSHWASRTMQEIGEDRAGVQQLHLSIRDRVAKEGKKRKKDIDNPDAKPGTYAANRALELLRYVYNRARRQVPALPENPTDNVDFFKRRVRDASLKTEELKPWWDKIHKECSPVKRDYYIAVLLTGGRRNQMAEAQWEHVDLDHGTWFFPKPKGGKERAYRVPISQHLVDVLKRRKDENEELVPGSPWVFPSERKQGAHLEKPRDDKRGLPLPHALRHTYKTHSLIAGIREVESHLLMNHSIGGANAGYISREVTLEDHLRPAQERITAYFLRQFGVLPPNVIEMPNLLAKSGS